MFGNNSPSIANLQIQHTKVTSMWSCFVKSARVDPWAARCKDNAWSFYNSNKG